MEFYRQFAHFYDAIFPVNASTTAFLAGCFGEPEKGRILDAGCGTGEYVLSLAEKGFQVSGVDLSMEMIDQAERKRQLSGLGDNCEFSLGDIRCLPENLTGLSGIFCIGNTLPHLVDPGAVGQTISGFYARLKPGGVLVIQTVNYDRILRQNIRELPAIKNLGAGAVLERYYDSREDGLIDFRTVLRIIRPDESLVYHNVVALRPLLRAFLETTLTGSGFTDVSWYGGFSREAALTGESFPMIVVAVKGA